MVGSVKPPFFFFFPPNCESRIQCLSFLQEKLQALGIDNLPHQLEKEQDLPQFCNVYTATSVVFLPCGLVMEHNGKEGEVYFLKNHLLIISI